MLLFLLLWKLILYIFLSACFAQRHGIHAVVKKTSPLPKDIKDLTAMVGRQTDKFINLWFSTTVLWNIHKWATDFRSGYNFLCCSVWGYSLSLWCQLDGLNWEVLRLGKVIERQVPPSLWEWNRWSTVLNPGRIRCLVYWLTGEMCFVHI